MLKNLLYLWKEEYILQTKTWTVCFLLVVILIIGGFYIILNRSVTMPITTNNFPNKPITMIVAFGAGGGADLVARALEKIAPLYLGQPIVVVNKIGGAGVIGWNELAGSNPDGYTLGITSTILQPLYESARYNYLTALTPLVRISSLPNVMLISADQPWQNVHEIIEYAKQHPGQLKFGHSGVGTIAHVVGEIFAQRAEIDIRQVPFRGGSESIAALLGNHVEITFAPSASAKEQIKSGAVRALAVSSEHRLTNPDLVQIPTFKEQGLDVVFGDRYGVAAPKGLPLEVKMKLAEGFKAMILNLEFKKSMNAIGLEVEYLGPQEAQDEWLADDVKFSKIIQETGILNRIKEQKN